MSIGDRIKSRRIELGMTQDELAKKCGYKSRTSINKIESSRDLPLRKVSVVAKALECSESYLMGWSDSFDNSVLNNRLLRYWNGLSKIQSEKEISEALKVANNYVLQEEPIKSAVRKLLDIEDEEK